MCFNVLGSGTTKYVLFINHFSISFVCAISILKKIRLTSYWMLVVDLTGSALQKTI